MPKELPVNPSVTQLKIQAKELLKAHKSGDPAVCARLKLLHRLAGRTDEQILSARITLADAQFVLAMEYGFATWNELRRHAEAGSKAPAGARFEKLSDLMGLDDRSIQMMLRELDAGDVVIATKFMDRELRERFLTNMSTRAREMVTADWDRLPPISPVLADLACGRILDLASDMAAKGEFATEEAIRRRLEPAPGVAEATQSAVSAAPAKRFGPEALSRHLSRRPASRMSRHELVDLLKTLAGLGRDEGMLAMAVFAVKHVDEELLGLGVRLVLQGKTPGEVREALRSDKDEILSAQGKRLDLLIAGVEGLAAGLPPEEVEKKCAGFV
jgi:hypothetical protein